MDAIQVVDRFFEEVWNQRKYAVLEEIIDPDCITHQLRSADGPIVSAPRGPAALRQHIEDWVTAFPDIIVSVDQRCRGAAHIVSWVTMRGRNDGPWQGVPPTRRCVTIRTVAQHRVEAGRIREDWVMVDALGLLQQLGIVGSTAELLAAAKTSSNAHFGAALFHGLVRRAGVFASMASFGWWRPRGRGSWSPVDGTPLMESNSAPLPQDAYLDQLLDEALEHTFPASDPIAIGIERKLPSRLVR